MSWPIIVPSDIDLTQINKCFNDEFCDFIHTQDLDQEIKKLDGQTFLVLQKDHFLVYTDKLKPAKCAYQSRNLIMKTLGNFNYNYHNLLRKGWAGYPMNTSKVTEDGVLICPELPVVYFVNSKDKGCVGHNNATEYNTVVAYFNGEVDIEKFAEITKSKKDACTHFFVVYLGNEMYRCYNTNDTSINYKYSAFLKFKVVKDVREDVDKILAFIEEDKTLADRRPKTERDPNFILKDTHGKPVVEGKSYDLKIAKDSSDDVDNGDEEDGRLDHDAISVFDDLLHGTVLEYDLPVNCEIIDGITYLKHDGKYLYASDYEGYQIRVKETLPLKHERLQFHIFDDNTFAITMWDKDIYAILEWIKCSYGSIQFDDGEVALRWGKPMRLLLS
ncbi:hypothetical protein H4219_004897 [Mycoemilia scoparia]|uniref:Uncharacterized protein n=1 Tax=Mycoemilia scoparia TaxID=417184 RepID=A0A9W7ZVS4_9FUNG|nr:hypothetical protein H4219_004897 [Mycoemilia scoparia]